MLGLENPMNDKTAAEIAGRCWDDPGMKHCQPDPTAARAIAAVLEMVLKANRHRLGMTTQDRSAVEGPSKPVGPQPVVGKA